MCAVVICYTNTQPVTIPLYYRTVSTTADATSISKKCRREPRTHRLRNDQSNFAAQKDENSSKAPRNQKSGYGREITFFFLKVALRNRRRKNLESTKSKAGEFLYRDHCGRSLQTWNRLTFNWGKNTANWSVMQNRWLRMKFKAESFENATVLVVHLTALHQKWILSFVWSIHKKLPLIWEYLDGTFVNTVLDTFMVHVQILKRQKIEIYLLLTGFQHFQVFHIGLSLAYSASRFWKHSPSSQKKTIRMT